MRFSVLIPVYNMAQYLDECLESVLNQSFNDFEVVLVDDGSTDTSADICDKYAKSDERVKVFHKSNGGVTSARKFGCLTLNGEYVVCLDADDVLDRNCLEKFNAVSNNGEIDIICCGMIRFGLAENKYNIPNSRAGLYSKRDIEEEILINLIENKNASSFTSSINAKAIRKELFITVQHEIDDDIKIGEDAACIKPCIFLAESMYVLHDCLYYYRYNLNSATVIAKPRNWKEPMLISNHLAKFIDLSKQDLKKQWYRNIVHTLFNVCITHIRWDPDKKATAKKIRTELKSRFYRIAAKNAKFKVIRGKFVTLAIKYRWITAMRIYAYCIKGKK